VSNKPSVTVTLTWAEAEELQYLVEDAVAAHTADGDKGPAATFKRVLRKLRAARGEDGA
jgi:hypothetical protein